MAILHEATDAIEAGAKKVAKAAEKQFAFEQAARIEQMEAVLACKSVSMALRSTTPATD